MNLDNPYRHQDQNEAGDGAPKLDNPYRSTQPAAAAPKLERPKPSSMLRRTLGDFTVDLGKGVLAVGEAVVGLANIPSLGLAGKGMEAIGYRPKVAKEMLGELYSHERKSANEQVEQAKGFVDTARTMLKNPSTIAGAVVESAPLMLGGGAVAQTGGKLLAGAANRTLAAIPRSSSGRVLLAGAGEGAIGAGAAAEGIRQETDDGLLTAKQAGAAIGSGLGTAAFGAAGGRVAQRLGILDPDVAAAGGALRMGDPATNPIRRTLSGAVRGAAAEGMLEEMPQSMQEQAWQNLALDKPLGEGVGEAAAQGLLAGAGMGGVSGGAGAAFARPKPNTNETPSGVARPLSGDIEIADPATGQTSPMPDPAGGPASKVVNLAAENGAVPTADTVRPAPLFPDATPGSLADAGNVITNVITEAGNPQVDPATGEILAPIGDDWKPGTLSRWLDAEGRARKPAPEEVQALVVEVLDGMDIRSRPTRNVASKEVVEAMKALEPGLTTKEANLAARAVVPSYLQGLDAQQDVVDQQQVTGEGQAAPAIADEQQAQNLNELSRNTGQFVQEVSTATTTDAKPQGQVETSMEPASQVAGLRQQVPVIPESSEGNFRIKPESAQAESKPDQEPEAVEQFAPETGTLGVPRAGMPQVPTKSHGGLVKHLNAQGIAHETTMVDAGSLKPTQAEYSPAKVEQSKQATGDRSIIVSSDGHIIDGHHQAVAAAEDGKQVKAIVLDVPVDQALEAVKNSPSATVETETQQTPPQGGVSVSAEQPSAANATAPSAPGAASTTTPPIVAAQSNTDQVPKAAQEKALTGEEAPESKPNQEVAAPTPGNLPPILTQPKAKHLARQAKQAGLKEGSPGYAEQMAKLEAQYETDLERAEASLPFEAFHARNPGPEMEEATRGELTAKLKGTAHTNFTEDESDITDAEKWEITTANGSPVYVYVEKNGNRLYIDASQAESHESRGAALYAALFQFALNTDRVFIGDPNGLSIEALMRRTEHMLSAALKHGTTRMMEPHPRKVNPLQGQWDGGPQKWAFPVKWTPGNDDANLAALAEASYNNLAYFMRGTDGEQAVYHFSDGRVLGAGGEPLSIGKLGRIASQAGAAFRNHPQPPGVERPAPAIGSSTVARAILAGTVFRAAATGGAQRSAVLADYAVGRGERAASGQGVTGDGIAGQFYSLPNEKTPPQGGVSRSGLSMDVAQRLKQKLTAKWGKDAPRVVLAESAQELVEVARRQGKDPNQIDDRVEGMHLGQPTVWLNLAAISTEKRFAEVLAHEAMGHYGVEQIVGDDWQPVVAAINRHVRNGTGTKDVRAAIAHLRRTQPDTSRDAIRTMGHIQRTLTDPDELRAHAVLQQMGALDKTQTHNLMGIAEGGLAGYNPKYAKAMEIIGWGFHKTEVVNREATGIAAFRLAVRAKNDDGSRKYSFDEAVKIAAEAIHETHYDYTNANRARFMQSGTAKVLLMFRQYSLNTTWHLGRMVWNATKGADPEVKRIARRNLAGILGMTALFSGTLGLPLMSVTMGVLNALAASAGDDDEPWDAETEFRKFLADMLGEDVARVVLGGVANEITGADIASRTSMSQLWFRDADRELDGRGAYFHLLEQAAGPMGGVLKNALVGKQLMDEGHLMRGVETVMPKALKDGLKAARYAREGVNNLRGDPLVADASLRDVLLQTAGFTPAKVAERYDENRALKNYEQHVLDRRQHLMNAFAMSMRLGDADGRVETMEQIRAFNRKWPAIAITPASIRRSLASRARYSQQAENGIMLNRKIAGRIREAVGVE